MIGPIIEAEYAQRIMENIKDEHRIHFKQSSRADILSTLGEYDCLVLPSRGEVFGIVLLEAMASGVIALGPSGDGPGEIIVDEVDGFQFHRGSVESLANVLEHIACLPATERVRITEAGRQKAYAHDWDGIVRNMRQELYE